MAVTGAPACNNNQHVSASQTTTSPVILSVLTTSPLRPLVVSYRPPSRMTQIIANALIQTPVSTRFFVMTTPPQERPNTIAGLQAKRKQLVKLRADLEGDVRKVTCDLDHIDACIRLFDPAADTATAIKRYATKHRAKKGQMRRFVLDRLKEATGPLTSLDIAAAWIADRGLKTDDGTRIMIRKRVGACLTSLRAQRFTHSPYQDGPHKMWCLVADDRHKPL